MNLWIALFFWVEAFLLCGLTLFGLHRVWMILLFVRYRNQTPKPKRMWQELPNVTVQLPVFNEPFVISRLLDAIERLDYPHDRLEIQVLDDSTDQTTQIAHRKVQELSQRGLKISLIHRNHRRGFKAGALASGLVQAEGELIAIFDADFIPHPDFLKKTIHYFTDSQVAMVQTRWGHLNQDFSYLTQVQALWLDAHFLIEQVVRSRAGYCFNFNGSAGIWRKAAIESAGGWSGDTLTEDLDLSYRAQLLGWKGIYLKDVVVPAELPMDLNSLKSQQHRWTKGTIQTAMKLFPAILQSQFPLRKKVEACFHLGNWFHFFLATLLTLFIFPSLILHQLYFPRLGPFMAIESFLAGFLMISTILFYSLAKIENFSLIGALRDLFWLMALSMGLSLNNSRAIFEALAGYRSSFTRTPKYASFNSARELKLKSAYALPAQGFWQSEILMGLYIGLVILYAVHHRLYGVIPFLTPIGIGFLYAGIGSLLPPTQET